MPLNYVRWPEVTDVSDMFARAIPPNGVMVFFIFSLLVYRRVHNFCNLEFSTSKWIEKMENKGICCNHFGTQQIQYFNIYKFVYPKVYAIQLKFLMIRDQYNGQVLKGPI